MKTLKTMFTIVLSFALCVMMFSACQSSKPDPQSGSNTTTTTTEATTTTTEAVTTTTEATTTTTAPTVEVALNTELLSCIGKTYSEISALYGELVEVSTGFEGGFPAYRLENSNGFFGFSGQTDWKYGEDGKRLPLPTDENGNWIVETAPLPKADAPCKVIWSVQMKDVFLGLTETVTGEELATMYNVEYTDPGYSQMEEAYVCAFIYEGLRLSVYTEADYMVGPDTIIYLIKATAN